MKKVTAILFVMVFALAVIVPTGASAAGDNPARDAANYSGNVVTGSVQTVADAAQGTTETAVSPIVAFWKWMTGKGKGENIVTDPINRGGKTVYDAAVDTGKTLTGQKL